MRRMMIAGLVLIGGIAGAQVVRYAAEPANSKRFLCIEIVQNDDGTVSRSEPRPAWVTSTGLAACAYEEPLPTSVDLSGLVTAD